MSQAKQKLALSFIKTQIGGKFNTLAYYFGFLLWFKIGSFKNYMLRQKMRWTCVSFVIACLQAANYKPALALVGTAFSPNSLYRMLRSQGACVASLRNHNSVIEV